MATEYEIVGRRDLPGIDAANPRAIFACVFYRKVGDPGSGDFVAVPIGKVSDPEIQKAIEQKEKDKGTKPARRFTVS